MNLDEALHRVHRAAGHQLEVAGEISSSLDDEGILVLSSWFLGSIEGDTKARPSVSLNRNSSGNESVDLRFSDLDDAVVVTVHPPDERHQPYALRLGSLIYIASISENHIESLVLLPPNLRGARIEEISAAADMDAQVVRRLLAAWIPRKSLA